MTINHHAAHLDPGKCKYEKGKSGKRHKDARKLFAKLAKQILGDKDEFTCAMQEKESYDGPSKSRKGVEIESYANDFRIHIKCNAACQNQGLQGKCLAEPFMLLPYELPGKQKRKGKKS